MLIVRNIKKYLKAFPYMKNTLDLQQFSYSVTTSKQIRCQRTKSLEQQTQKYAKSKKKPSQSQAVQTLGLILEWRKNNEAPVDTMGCQRLADPKAPPQVQKFQTLVALMLSVQTKDETTAMIVNRLKEQGLTPEKIAGMDEDKLRTLIYQSNFNKRKSANLIAVSKMILEKGRIAKTKEELLAYPGVGIKIAMIYLKVAEGKEEEGIGVDTHVHRIANRLGWVKTTAPQETEQGLQDLFPSKHWKDINIGLVGFGQTICNSKKPLCKGCPVQQICPSRKYDW